MSNNARVLGPAALTAVSVCTALTLTPAAAHAGGRVGQGALQRSTGDGALLSAVAQPGHAREAVQVVSPRLRSSGQDPIRLARDTVVLRTSQLSALRRATCVSAGGAKGSAPTSACTRYWLSFSPPRGRLSAVRPGWHLVAGVSPALPGGLLMTITAVRRSGHRELMIVGRAARLDEAIQGTWNASVPIRATRALLAHAHLRRGVRFSLAPFPAQRELLRRRRAGHGRRARAADSPLIGIQPGGFYARLNNLDLTPFAGAGPHLYLTAYATISPRLSVGTDPAGCPQNSCPGTAWHAEAGFGIELQKAQLALGFADQKIGVTWNPTSQELETLKSTLRSGPLVSITWGTLPFDPIEFVLPIGPVPVPVVITQDVKLTTDVKLRALFGIQANVNFGFNVGAGIAWVSGGGPFDAGHLEGIGYREGRASWGGNVSESASLLTKILAKLGGDPSESTWLVGAALKLIPLNIHYQLALYGVVGADFELHLPYINFQATWNINQCNVTFVGTGGIEGGLKALVRFPTEKEYKTPLELGYAEQWFKDTLPAPGVGCPSPPSSKSGPTTAPATNSPGTSPPNTSPPPQHGPGYYVYHVHGSCSGSVCGINERTGPGFGYSVVGGKAEGAEVDIVCQTTGDVVNGTIGGSSDIWDRLTDGNYVADLFVDTPGVGVFSDPPIPHC
jgi:hypothetical protein